MEVIDSTKVGDNPLPAYALFVAIGFRLLGVTPTA
jgi:hypothetical protein